MKVQWKGVGDGRLEDRILELGVSIGARHLRVRQLNYVED